MKLSDAGRRGARPSVLQTGLGDGHSNNDKIAAVHMSAFGTKRTFRDQAPMSAFGGKADIRQARHTSLPDYDYRHDCRPERRATARSRALGPGAILAIRNRSKN